MARSRIFEWIRAVAAAPLSAGCHQFCLQLIPLVDSRTLRSSLSIQQVSRRVTAQPDTIKKYRRQLKAEGLLSDGRGWQLALSTESLSSGCTDTPGVHTDTGTLDQCPQRHPKVSTETPSIYYRSTSLSASLINEGTHPSASIEQLVKKQRPDVQDREPCHEVDVLGFMERWRLHKGSKWPWPFWAEAVLPYLSQDEAEELLGALLATADPNLGYAVSIVSRMCAGKSSPKRRGSARQQQPGAVPTVVAGRSKDDDDFLAAISR